MTDLSPMNPFIADLHSVMDMKRRVESVLIEIEQIELGALDSCSLNPSLANSSNAPDLLSHIGHSHERIR